MSLNPLNYEYEWAAIVALIAASVALFGSWRANKIAERNINMSAEAEILRIRENRHTEAKALLGNFLSATNTMNYDAECETKAIHYYNQIAVLLEKRNPHADSFIQKMVQLITRNPEKPYPLKEFDKIWTSYFEWDWDDMTKEIGKYNAKNK